MYPIILYDNRFADATPVASATDADPEFAAAHIADLRTHTFWQADAAGTFYLSVDCGAAAAADALGIVRHNLGSAGATVSVESSATGAWGGEETERLEGFSPSDDEAILKLLTSATDRYWRIKIVSPTIAPYLAVAMLGERLQFSFPPDTPYIPYTETPQEDSARSGTGQMLGSQVTYQLLQISPSFSQVERSWVLGDYQTFWEAHSKLRQQFFYAWDLDVFPAHVFFVRDKAPWRTPLSALPYVDRIALDLEGSR